MKNKIRFGLQLDFRNPNQWQRPWHNFYSDMISFVAWTETIGFGSIWLSEHHGAKDGYCPSPLIAATAIATKTKHIRIGTAIAIAPLYHPVRLAEECAILDIISNGRLELGLGAGYREPEFCAYGQTLKARGRQFDEILEIIRRLWAGETFDFKGQFYQLQAAVINPRPIQQHLPILIGGFNDAALRRAARFSDGIIGGSDANKRWGFYQNEIEEIGNDPKLARLLYGLMWFLVSDTPEQTWEEVAPHVLHQVSTYAQWTKGTENESAFTAITIDELKTSDTLEFVSPEEAIEKIETLINSTPITDIYGYDSTCRLSLR